MSGDLQQAPEKESHEPHPAYAGDANPQTNTQNERNFRNAGFAALLLLSFTLWQSFLSTGIVYGWPSLLNLLRSEGVYSQYCHSSSSCDERTVAFNLVFTIGGATNVSGAVLCGLFVDRCGPRNAILTGLVLIIVGSFFMGFSDVQSEFAWPLAYAFYGLGGCCVHLSGFSLGNAFGRSKGFVISMLVSVFSISALLFQGFDLLYRSEIDRQIILLLHVSLEALNFCVSAWLWPRDPLPPGTELRWSGCRISAERPNLSKSTGIGLKELCGTACRTAFTWKFVCFLTFHFSQLFLNRCLMGWMEAILQWKSQNLIESGGLDVQFQLSMFNLMQSAAGFIAIPLFGFLVARFGHRHAPFCATALLAVLFLAIQPLVWEWTLPVLYLLAACHRQMFFSTFFTYISAEYPPQLFATLSGFANVLAGLGTTLQNPLLDVVLRNLDGNFLPVMLVQLGVAAMVLLGCAAAWCRAAKHLQSEVKSEGDLGDLGDSSPPTLRESDKI